MKKMITTEKGMIALGRQLAKTLRGGEVMIVDGELGSGKTTLVKGIAAGLGIKKMITSPTFVLAKHYPVKQNGIRWLVHVDLYRLETTPQLTTLGLEDYLGAPDSVVVIEWGKKLKLSKNTALSSVTIVTRKDNRRTIVLTTPPRGRLLRRS